MEHVQRRMVLMAIFIFLKLTLFCIVVAIFDLVDAIYHFPYLLAASGI